MTRFAKPGTTTVPLGRCDCPDKPHPDGDSAEVYDILGWDDLVDIRDTAKSAGQRALTLVTRAVASWTLQERNGDGRNAPVRITEANVHRLDDVTSDLLWPTCLKAFEAAEAPLPNGSGEQSPASPPESSPSTPTIRTPAKPTS